MKNILIVAAVVAAVFTSCGAGGGRMKTDVDSMSYAYGVHIGYNLKMQDSTMNANLIAKGFIDAYTGKTEMTPDSAMNVLNEYFMVKLPKKKEKEEVVYLESVEKNHAGVQKSETGLLYEILEPGDTAVMPTDTDNVLVNYVGRFREGAEYDANKTGKEFDNRDSTTLQLANMLPGWTEGLKKLGKGGKIRMWIPSAIGYGNMGNQQWGGPIGPFEPLVFEVDLLDVIPVAPVAEEAKN